MRFLAFPGRLHLTGGNMRAITIVPKTRRLAVSILHHLLLAWSFLVVLFSVPAQAMTYAFAPFNCPGSTQTIPTAINNAGQIVGTYLPADSSQPVAFIYDGNQCNPITVEGGTSVAPYDVTN